MRYYILWYTDKLPPDVGGRANGPFIRIKKKWKGDIGLLEHEKCHVRQWWKSCGLHGLLKRFKKDYKLNCEVEAFKIQLGYNPKSLRFFARYLSTHYGFDISVNEAQGLLSN